MKFVGVDALWREGVAAVREGQLDATFWYPTCGKEAIEIAMRVLRGEEVPRRVELPTALITRENADEWHERLRADSTSGEG